jgi:hypothetical protein
MARIGVRLAKEEVLQRRDLRKGTRLSQTRAEQEELRGKLQ